MLEDPAVVKRTVADLSRQLEELLDRATLIHRNLPPLTEEEEEAYDLNNLRPYNVAANVQAKLAIFIQEIPDAIGWLREAATETEQDLIDEFNETKARDEKYEREHPDGPRVAAPKVHLGVRLPTS